MQACFDRYYCSCSASVQTIDLIQYLGNYVTKKSPTGYTLPAFPWCEGLTRVDWGSPGTRVLPGLTGL